MNRLRVLAPILFLAAFGGLCFFVPGCQTPKDIVGGGGCEDKSDVVIEGSVQYETGKEDFKARLDYLEDNDVQGTVLWRDLWYDIVGGSTATHDMIHVGILVPNPGLWSSCQEGYLLHVLDLSSNNGLAGPFDGGLYVYCGQGEDPGLRVHDPYDATDDVTCEDL